MRRLDLAGAGAVLIGLAAPAAARSDSHRFDIAPGPLGHVVATIGAQAGVTIGVADPALAIRPSPGVRGSLEVGAALGRATRGTGTHAVPVDAWTWRIVADPPRRPPILRPRPILPETETAAPQRLEDIIVTATKIPIPVARYPGSIEILDRDDPAGGGGALEGALLAVPTISSTSLGPGRDKLFIRGIADSSFNGPTQETVALYLDDVRLTYNAPDPDLNLYDMRRIEVLVGPQETLYGTGALGGIVRLSPALPDPSAAAGSAALGLSATAHGGIGGDAAAMLNLPLGDRTGLRLVGYRTIDAGYIDDPARGLSDINRTIGTGGRIALRLDDRGGWTFDFGGVLQNMDSRDGQYTLRGDPPLTRANLLAQPFDNDYRLAYATARRRIGGAELVSTTSIVDHHISSTFDATGFVGDGPAVLREDTSITLISHETRLSGDAGGTPWIVGFSLMDDISRVNRMLGAAAAPPAIASVRNDNLEGALYAHLSWPLAPRLIATIGGRATFSRSVGGLLGHSERAVDEPRRSGFRATPSLSLSWQAAPRLQLYGRYQLGTRAGGLAVKADDGVVSAQRFRPDRLTLVEIGLRRPVSASRAIWAHAALSYVGWNNIQADLIDDRGLPFTTNIGDGRVLTGEVGVGWRPIRGLTLEASGFISDSALSSPTADLLPERARSLPNVPARGARASASWHQAIAPGLQLAMHGSLRYVGRSQLGIGPPLDVGQGDYVVAAAGARLSRGRFGLSLDIDNIADARANRFAFGNPFGLERGDQETPLRPRTVRIGIDAKF